MSSFGACKAYLIREKRSKSDDDSSIEATARGATNRIEGISEPTDYDARRPPGTCARSIILHT